MSIEIRKLTGNIGAEIAGVDLTKPMDDATFAPMFEAFNEHSVLVFHEQDFDDDCQIAFSSISVRW